MTKLVRCVVFALVALVATAGTGRAQTPASASNDGWKVTVYPIFGWLPLGIDMDLKIPPVDIGGGGSGEGIEAKIIDSRFDGAFFGGFSASRGLFRIDADGLWAGVGGDRDVLPVFNVDADAIYFHVTAGLKVANNLYVTGGVRRLATKYVIKRPSRPDFERKPGVWDPLVGLGYHSVGEKLEFHAVAEGGGFGVGSDVELSGSARVDWKFARHVGLTAGYNFLYFKVTNTVAKREFVVKQTLHGPMLGIGIYF